ncbi:molybdopterin-containing oxidoreductase family protein [Bacterioplanoides sp.]|uniref:molybdopterin-containing oxidoreductase family protein n=1 Tax=Bacterioplanoides sp. TaxID=2066072 RepID=UPI003B5B2E82
MTQPADNSAAAIRDSKTKPLHASACVLCSMNCGLQLDVEDNQILRIKADDTNPITLGHICNKAYSVNHYVHHKQRLSGPLKRSADQSGHQSVSWDNALSEIGHRLRQIADIHGGDKIAMAGLGGQGNHSDVLHGLAMLKSFKSPWFFSAYAQEKTQHHLVERWMLGSPPHSMIHPDPWNSDVLVVIGCNPIHSNRGYKTQENLREFKKQGKQLIVIDPRKSETARKADIHVAHKPGTDVWLLSAMVSLVVNNNWIDQSFVVNHTRDYDEILNHFRGLDIDDLCQRCDVEPEQLLEITRAYATADKGSLFWDTGVEWIPNTTLVSWLLRVLLTITGNFGRPGGNTLRPGFMADGHLLESKVPFVAPASGIVGIPALGPFEMFSPNLLVDEIEAGNIKALVVSSANPLRSYANSEAMKAAFAKLELLVVMDTSYTETAMEADYVLACPGGYEKWEWTTFGRKFPKLTSHLRPPVIQPMGDVKTEAEIFHRIVEASGGPAKAPKWLKMLGKKGWENPLIGPAIIATAMVEAKANPVQAFVRWVNWSYDALGHSMPQGKNGLLAAKNATTLWLTCQLASFTRFRQFENIPTKNPFKLGTQWFRQIVDNPNGTILATLPWEWHMNEALGHKDKKIRLYPQALRAAWQRVINEQPVFSDEYPIWLAAGERSPWTANTIQRDGSWRKGRAGRCLLKINPEQAAEMELANDDWVELETLSGKVQMQVTLDKGMRRDNLSMPNGMGLLYPDEQGALKPYGVNTNDLTHYQWRDEFTGIPFHKTVPCKVTKLIQVEDVLTEEAEA